MANKEHLEMLRNDQQAWNDWREANPQIVIDLEGANLEGLKGGGFLDLHEANLEGANLSKLHCFDGWVNFTGAKLRGAILENAFLAMAHLQSADLTQTKCAGTNFQDASLEGANLEAANFESAVFMNADISHTNLKNANLKKANLRGVFLSHADLEYANLEEADLAEGYDSAREARFDGANLKGARLVGADLNGASFNGADLTNADLRNCQNLTCEQLHTARNWQSARRDLELVCGAPLPDEQIEEIRAQGLGEIRTVLRLLYDAHPALIEATGADTEITASRSNDICSRIGHNNPPACITESINDAQLSGIEHELRRIAVTLGRVERLYQEPRPEPSLLHAQYRTLRNDLDTFRSAVARTFGEAIGNTLGKPIRTTAGAMGLAWLYGQGEKILETLAKLIMALGVG